MLMTAQGFRVASILKKNTTLSIASFAVHSQYTKCTCTKMREII